MMTTTKMPLRLNIIHPVGAYKTTVSLIRLSDALRHEQSNHSGAGQIKLNKSWF